MILLNVIETFQESSKSSNDDLFGLPIVSNYNCCASLVTRRTAAMQLCGASKNTCIVPPRIGMLLIGFCLRVISRHRRWSTFGFDARQRMYLSVAYSAGYTHLYMAAIFGEHFSISMLVVHLWFSVLSRSQHKPHFRQTACINLCQGDTSV